MSESLKLDHWNSLQTLDGREIFIREDREASRSSRQ